MKSVKAFLPAGEPAGGIYSPAPAVTRHDDGQRRRRAALSEKQRKTVLGAAAARVKAAAASRSGQWLRRLDDIHASGCRLKQQRWDALAALIEPMLTRLDLATLVLGWLDDSGEFHLNRQCTLARAAELTDCRVSRTLKALEAARYVVRRQRRLYLQGTQWVTRTMIYLMPKFFIDLGLGHSFAQARTAKKARRAKVLAGARREQERARLQHIERQALKKQRRERAALVERSRQERAANDAAQATAAQTQRDFLAFVESHPDLSDTERLALWRRLNPT